MSFDSSSTYSGSAEYHLLQSEALSVEKAIKTHKEYNSKTPEKNAADKH